MTIPYYDIIIIGSGMSGLYSAYQIQKISPKTSFLILEKFTSHVLFPVIQSFQLVREHF
jgi:cation diffusion facilitator CzcD-associated flavoprotein CzcO